MAYDDSGEIPVSQSTYSLGGYTFELKVQNVHEPGEEPVVSVFAICHSPDGSRQTQAMDFPDGTEIEAWFVEANETEASVYVKVEGHETIPFVTLDVTTATDNRYLRDYYCPNAVVQHQGGSVSYIGHSSFPCSLYVTQYNHGIYIAMVPPFERSGSFYVASFGGMSSGISGVGLRFVNLYNNSSATFVGIPESSVNPAGLIPKPSVPSGEYLVGRFAIDIREADGGPDGDWDEPGSDGPPNKTLYVTVTGASAGSHSPTVFPLENSTIKGYGFGGDGGHGGGGGAGASTVIIYDFATSKADEVVQEAITKPPMAGSGGGKGGKGGDGCILIFY